MRPFPQGFLGAGAASAGGWVIFGAPLDATGSFRPGSRFGPAAIRGASPVLEDWSPALGRGLSDRPFADLGDLDLPPADVSASLGVIEATVREIGGEGRRPLMLGGEHLVTWPAVTAVAASHPELAVVQLDAHCDLRDDYMGRRASHATVMRRVSEVVSPTRCFQLGLRSGTQEEWAFARTETRSTGRTVLPADWWEDLRHRPVYLTVDIDVADPAYAPGTGTPEPGGATSAELLAAIDALEPLRIVGADVVEVAPAYDAGGITAALAAKVVREILLM